MMKKLIVILFICFLTGCIRKEEQILKTNVILAKATEDIKSSAISRGRTNYILAFTDGQTLRVNAGQYAIYNEGDTLILRTGSKSLFWYIVKKK